MLFPFDMHLSPETAVAKSPHGNASKQLEAVAASLPPKMVTVHATFRELSTKPEVLTKAICQGERPNEIIVPYAHLFAAH